MPLLGHLSFPWAVVVFVHPNHPFHLVPVDLGVWMVPVPHIPICFPNFSSIVVALDLMVVVNHLLYCHLHHHHHHCHFLHFSLGEVAYHPLHCHHHSHYHLHYHRWRSSSSTCWLLRCPSTPFQEWWANSPTPTIWWLWWAPTTLNRLVGSCTISSFLQWHSFSSSSQWWWHPTPIRSSCGHSSPWC